MKKEIRTSEDDDQSSSDIEMVSVFLIYTIESQEIVYD